MAFLGVLAPHSFADDNTKLALLIGNADYSYAPLKNPINDITDLGKALDKLGFDVTILENPSYQQSLTSIDSFYKKIALDYEATTVFYYAGHAVQMNNMNYMIPVDAKIIDSKSLAEQSVSINHLLKAMQQTINRKNLVILDACRNNPFAIKQSKQLSAARSLPAVNKQLLDIDDGLAPVEAPAGTIIAYATEPGNVAKDGSGRNGTYTKYLLRHMRKHVTIEEVFKKVRKDVVAATKGQQIPWEHSSLYKTVYFYPPRNKAMPDIGGF